VLAGGFIGAVTQHAPDSGGSAGAAHGSAGGPEFAGGAPGAARGLAGGPEFAGGAPGAAHGSAGGPPDPPPGYVWVSPPPRQPPWRAPRWLKVLTAIWAVVIVVGGAWYALHGRPSVREQTTIGEARSVVDRAVVDVVNAAGGAPVVSVSGFVRIDSCRITPLRSGASYRRVVDLYTSPGTESTILHTIAARLPTRYHGQATAGRKPTLYADAGDYVAVRGSVPAAGVVEVAAVTGCRQDSGAGVNEPAPGSATVAALTPVLRALGHPAAAMATVASLACPGGGRLDAVEATLPPGSAPTSLAAALAGASANPVASGPAVYAFRDGAVDVVARTDSGTHAVTVTATSRCG
jgi:hypothetical protein